MRLLVIRWDEATRVWLVVDADSREVVERVERLMDAGWFVQSEEAVS